MADEKIPSSVSPAPSADIPQEVPLEKIHPLRGVMPRRRIDRDLGGLVQSIKSQGIMEPVVLRLREDGEYELVSGYRRMRASEMARKDTITAFVRQMSLEEAKDYFSNKANDPKQKNVLPGKPVAVEQAVPEAPADAVKSPDEAKTTGTTPTKAEEKKPAEPNKSTADAKPTGATPTKAEEKKPIEPAKTSADSKPTGTAPAKTDEKKPTEPTKTPADAKPTGTTPTKAEEKKPTEPTKTSADTKSAGHAMTKAEEKKPVEPTEGPAGIKSAGPATAKTEGKKPTEPTKIPADAKPTGTTPTKAEEKKPTEPTKTSADAKPTVTAPVKTEEKKLTEPVKAPADTKPTGVTPAKTDEKKPIEPAKTSADAKPTGTAPTKTEEKKLTEPVKAPADTKPTGVTPAKTEETKHSEPTKPPAGGKSAGPSTAKAEEKKSTEPTKAPAADQGITKLKLVQLETPLELLSRVDYHSPVYNMMMNKLLSDGDVYIPIAVKKGRDGRFNAADDNAALVIAAARSVNLKELSVHVTTGKDQGQEEDESLGKLVRLPLDDLHSYSDHKWRVEDHTESMMQLVSSIQEQGVQQPIVVRPDPKGGYEVVSGHRRLRASQLAHKKNIPAIIQGFDDDKTAILVNDLNTFRSDAEISTMERAHNLRQKFEARQRQIGRRAKGEESQGRGDIDWARQEGLSKNKMYKLIRLPDLIPELQQMMDQEIKSINIAYELTFLPVEKQQEVYRQIKMTGKCPSLEEAQKMRRGDEPPAKGEEPEQETAEPTIQSDTPGPPKQEPSPVSVQPPADHAKEKDVPAPAATQASPIVSGGPSIPTAPQTGQAEKENIQPGPREEVPSQERAPGPLPTTGPINIMEFLEEKAVPPPQPGPVSEPQPTVPPDTEPPESLEDRDPSIAYNVLIEGRYTLEWFGKDLTPLQMKSKILEICSQAAAKEHGKEHEKAEHKTSPGKNKPHLGRDR